MTTQTYTAEQAVNTLVAEGHDRAAVTAAFDSLVDAGLELDQPDEGYLLTAAEVDVLRDQLSGTSTTPAETWTATYTEAGHLLVDDAEIGHYDADGRTWQDEVREILRRAGYQPVGEWTTGTDGDSRIQVR